MYISVLASFSVIPKDVFLVLVSLYEFDFVFSSTKFVYETPQAVLMQWIYSIFNPLTPTTSLVILFTL